MELDHSVYLPESFYESVFVLFLCAYKIASDDEVDLVRVDAISFLEKSKMIFSIFVFWTSYVFLGKKTLIESKLWPYFGVSFKHLLHFDLSI